MAMTNDIAALVAELTALLEKSTPGPWLIRTLENFGFNIVHYVDGDKFNIQRVAKAGDEDDAKLIVALRNNAKPLLDALQSLQAERDEALRQRDEQAARYHNHMAECRPWDARAALEPAGDER